MISIIIPLYNKEFSISKALNTVLSQTYRDFEIIIVNDGSTDNSLSVCEAIKCISNTDIKIVNKENGGVCSARNRGIEEAKYDYIALLDADDLWPNNYLESQVQMIYDFPEAAMWGANYYELNFGEPRFLQTGLSDDHRGYVENYFGFKHHSDLFHPSSVVIRKEVFKKVGYFDTRIKYAEDSDMWYRIILNYKVAFNALLRVAYVQDAENRALDKPIRLKYYLPYYVDKYNEYCSANYIFSHYIHTLTAARISKYYFHITKERKYAREVIKKLRYKDIHVKYRLWYKSPYLIGLIIYKLVNLKHKLKI